MNVIGFSVLLVSVLLAVNRVSPAPLTNDGQCSQQMEVGGEKMWITDVLANHNCQMEELFRSVMGRTQASAAFMKVIGSSPAANSICAGLIAVVSAAEQKRAMDAVCASLEKNWEGIFCKEYYGSGRSVEVLKKVADYRQSKSLPPQISTAIDYLVPMDQTSCLDVCGGGKGFICKAFMRLLVAYLNPSAASKSVDVAGEAPEDVTGGPNVAPTNPAMMGKAVDGISRDGLQPGGNGQEGAGFLEPKTDQQNQPGPPGGGPGSIDSNRPNPSLPKAFMGDGRRPNISQLMKFLDQNTRLSVPERQPQTGVGQPQTGDGQPQAGFGPPQTSFGPPQTAGRGPPTVFKQPQPGSDNPSLTSNGQPQTSAGQPQTGAGQPQTGAGPPQNNAVPPQTNRGQPQTNLQQPQTNAGQPQTNVGQPQTNTGLSQTTTEQPQTNFRKPQIQMNAEQPQNKAEQPQTNAKQPQTNANQPQTSTQDRGPTPATGTRTAPPNKLSEDLLMDEDGDEDGGKLELDESDEEDDKERDAADKTRDGDDEDEWEKMEELSRPRFKNGPPTPSKPKFVPPPPKDQGEPRPPNVLENPPLNLHSRPLRPPSLRGKPDNPVPVNIKSVDSAVSEDEQYHGHSPVFFLTILCVVVLSSAMCYACVANRMRVRETLHIILTSKGSKARREYR